MVAARLSRTSCFSCLHCQQPLGALTLARGLMRCDAAACRAKDSQQALEKRWAAVANEALATAARETAASLKPLTSAPRAVLWLEHGGRTLAPVNDRDRAFLAARWLQSWHADEGIDYGGHDTAVDLPAAAQALCGYCGGRCCAYGSGQAAFVDAPTLRRWLVAHPGASVEDAIADYLAYLPAQHVEGQCCFQSDQGCTLPREHRADVCNQYRCAALSQLGLATDADADASAVVLTRNGWRLQAAAVFSQGVATPLVGLQACEPEA